MCIGIIQISKNWEKSFGIFNNLLVSVFLWYRYQYASFPSIGTGISMKVQTTWCPSQCIKSNILMGKP